MGISYTCSCLCADGTLNSKIQPQKTRYASIRCRLHGSESHYRIHSVNMLHDIVESWSSSVFCEHAVHYVWCDFSDAEKTWWTLGTRNVSIAGINGASHNIITTHTWHGLCIEFPVSHSYSPLHQVQNVKWTWKNYGWRKRVCTV